MYVLYADGANRVCSSCVERARVSVSDATCVCLCACLRVFVG